jgi:hypothetical protein
MVSPIRTITAPSANLASRPVSTESDLPGANSTLLKSSFIIIILFVFSFVGYPFSKANRTNTGIADKVGI